MKREDALSLLREVSCAEIVCFTRAASLAEAKREKKLQDERDALAKLSGPERLKAEERIRKREAKAKLKRRVRILK